MPARVAGGATDEVPIAAGPVIRPGLSSVPLVAVLVVALFAMNLVGYLPELVLAYRDYNGISPAGLKAVSEAGFEAQTVVFVSSDWPDWQSYGQVFLANGPFLDGNIIYVRDLGEAENWRLMNRYPEWRWWQLKDLRLTELHQR